MRPVGFSSAPPTPATNRSADPTDDDPARTVPNDPVLAAVVLDNVNELIGLIQRMPQRVRELDGQACGLIHQAIDFDASPRLFLELLHAGADPNRPDSRGLTPLHRASRENRLDWIHVLLLHGADPEQRTPDGRRAVDLSTDTDCQARILAAIIDTPFYRLRFNRGGLVGMLMWAYDETRRAGYCSLL